MEPVSPSRHAPKTLALALERDVESGAIVGYDQHQPRPLDAKVNLHARTLRMPGGIVHRFLEHQEHVPADVHAELQLFAAVWRAEAQLDIPQREYLVGMLAHPSGQVEHVFRARD